MQARNKLQGSRILVVGGTSGLGFGVAEASIVAGAAEIIISSSNPTRVKSAIERLQRVCSDADNPSCQVVGLVCDLSDEDEIEPNIETMFSDATSSGRRKLNHVVHTAGDKLAIRPLDEFDLDSIKQAGMTRFFAPLLVAKYARRHLVVGKESSITLTSGAGSEKPRADWAVVASFLSGVYGMARGLAVDLKPIRVNLIVPGAVETELWDDMPAGALEQAAKRTATGAVGKVEDVSEAYLYCMKDYNLTGSIIHTNGGSLIV